VTLSICGEKIKKYSPKSSMVHLYWVSTAKVCTLRMMGKDRARITTITTTKGNEELLVVVVVVVVHWDRIHGSKLERRFKMNP